MRPSISPRLAILFALAALVVSPVTASLQEDLPPSGDDALAHLNGSTRHGEWTTVTAGGEEIDAWLVYPERSDDAPVVVVIHEIYGMTDWIRAVADQLAAEGFIAIAPDLLSGKGPDGGGTVSFGSRDGVVQAIRGLDPAEVKTRLDASAEHAMGLPAARSSYGVVGFCWGGSTSFRYATQQAQVDAAVVYYGGSPDTGNLADVEAPVLGLYGGNDNRVNATIPDARDEMDRLGKTYETEIYPGAGHGFLRQQDGQEGANMAATRQAWPRTVEFFRTHLES